MFQNNIYQLEAIAILLKAGLSFQICIEQLYIQKVINQSQHQKIEAMINQGHDSVDIILALNSNRIFNEYFSFFIKSHPLDQAIIKALEIMNELKQIKNNLFKRLWYPCLLVMIITLVMISANQYLLPQIISMMNAFELDLPFYLKILMVVFKIIPMIILLIILIGLSLYFLFKYFLKKRHDIVEKIFSLKFINRILSKYCSLIYAIYLKELLKTNKLNYDLFKLLNSQTRIPLIQITSKLIVNDLSNGININDVIKQSIYFDQGFKRLFYLGNASNNLCELVDVYYHTTLKSITNKINYILAILTPIILGFIGLFIILLYLSFMMPMLSIIETI